MTGKLIGKIIRKIIKYILAAAGILAVYVAAGIILSYGRQPDVSEEYRSSFQVSDFYSEEESPDRAYVIEDNTEALVERLRMIEQAKERIVLSTFEFRADESGKDMIAALTEAAGRGVEIKVLADGAAAFLQMDRNPYFCALASMDTVEIRIYNRINLLAPWKSMGRLHDKYVIADNDLYLLGGRNTYDYFLGDNGYKNYDRDVLVYTRDPDSESSSIHQLEDYFQSVWALKECSTYHAKGKQANGDNMGEIKAELKERHAENLEKYRISSDKMEYAKKTFATNKITLLFNPIHVYAKEPTVFYALTELMKETQGEVLIHTPYVICNDWMYQRLEEICSRNPQVSMLTNSAANNGNPFGASDYLKNRKKLLDTGLQMYEYEGGVSYHGKSITVGEELAIVGSFNMDMRSAYLDTELMLVIDSRGVNRQLKDDMQEYEKQSARILDAEHFELPEGVKRQEITGKRAVMVKVVGLFNWLRFLM